MKHIPAYLLALVFIVFGANWFFHFIPMPTEMPDLQAKFFEVFGPSGYMTFVKVLEIVFGIMLLIPQTRALALILIAPICVNILCFELFVAKQPGIGIALVLINLAGLYLNREKYSSILS